MSIYKIEGKIFNTDLAKGSWRARRVFDGRQMIDVNTNSNSSSETLYLSSKDTYYLECDVSFDGEGENRSEAWKLTSMLAATWLLFNEKALPVDLADWAAQLEE